MLSKKQVHDVCLVYQAAHQCRYLKESAQHASWDCLKHCVSQKQVIDDKTMEYEAKCKKQNVDPMKQQWAVSDNCPGYAYLPNIEQGYDK